MPHQCTACGYTFADGSKEMLGGCPDCGGNKFQFYPEGTEVPDEPPGDDDPPEPEEPGGTASTVGRAATRVRDFVAGDPAPPDAEGEPAPHPDADAEPTPQHDPSAASTPQESTEPTDSTGDATPASAATDATPTDGSSDDGSAPDPDAPWPDSSDAADPVRKGGFADEDAEDEPATDEDGIIDADARATADAVEDAEDPAQSDARSGVASESELEAAAGASDDAGGASADPTDATPTDADRERGLAAAETSPEPADGRVVSEPSGEEADLAELREQLNDQFESIKILEPGQYELNLMELYDRDEYIIALQENGRYVIQVPEQWMSDREDR